MSETKKETDVTGHIESRSTDSLLSQLTKEPLGVRHALHASQTEFSLFLWTLGVYECVGASGPIWGMSHPTRSLWATGRILSPPFPWIPSLQTGAKSGDTWSPLRVLTRGRQGLWPSVTLFEGRQSQAEPPLLLPSGPLDLSASRGQLPAICLHLALHPCNKDPPWQPA